MATDFTSFIPWLVWVIPIIGAILTPIFAAMSSKLRDYLAVTFSLISAIMAALMLPAALAGETVHSTIPWIQSLNIQAGVLADPLSALMANVVSWISFLIMVYSLGYMKGQANLTRYWFFMLFFIGNMQLIVLSDNFLQLFFGWEGVGLCSYGLIGFWHTDEKKYWVGNTDHSVWRIPQAYSPSHAGMKALITTRIGDVSFLIGLLILYAYTGTFSFTELAQRTDWARQLAGVGLLVPVAILIFGGAVGKSAQFPLQEWLPDAMAGPTAVSALIHAATMVKAGVFLVARIGPIFYAAAVVAQQITPLFETIAWIGVFTAFLAATQALVGREIKKVLAYSTVSQIGYMILALGVTGLAADFTTGFTAGFFHLTSHAVFKAGLFLGAGALIHATESKYLHDMGGLRKNMKITFAAMLIAAASLAGIPPLSGFWSKDAVLSSVLGAGHYSLTPVLFTLAVATAIITVFYSFRMLGLVFFGNKSDHLNEIEKEGHHVHEAPAVMWIPYSILAVATVAIGLAGPLFEETLHGIFGQYLEAAFGIEAVEASAGMNPIALTASLGAVLLGGFLGYYFYIARKVDPIRIVESNFILKGLYRFLYNRWYINSFFYIIFVNGSISLSRSAFRIIETGAIDRINMITANGSVFFSRLSDKFDVYVVDGFVNGVAYVATIFSRLSRAIQTGITEHYVLGFVVGIILVLVMMILGSSVM